MYNHVSASSGLCAAYLLIANSFGGLQLAQKSLGSLVVVYQEWSISICNVESKLFDCVYQTLSCNGGGGGSKVSPQAI